MCTVSAQESTSFRITEHTFNAGGNPVDGTTLTSTSYTITFAAVGSSVIGLDLTSASYRMDGSFVAGYGPPGEIAGVSFADPTTLSWGSDRSAAHYNLYRDRIRHLDGLGFGICEQQGIPTNTTTVVDAGELGPGDGYFYLVTAVNRLDEEGTKGSSSDGPEREGAICP